MKTKRKKAIPKIDPYHCRCFSILKSDFRYFKAKMQSDGYDEPIFEDDHSQILGFTKHISQYHQIHVKLMRTGKIEAEIEYSQDYPMAHLNQMHSYSAHPELNELLSTMQIPYKCKLTPHTTCINRQIIPANNPTHLNTFLALGGTGALLDIFLNKGKLTGTALDILSKQLNKSMQRKKKRRKYLQ